MESFCQSPSRRIRDASAVNLPTDKLINPAPAPPAYRALSSGPTADLSYITHYLNSPRPRFSRSCANTLFELLFYTLISELSSTLNLSRPELIRT